MPQRYFRVAREGDFLKVTGGPDYIRTVRWEERRERSNCVLQFTEFRLELERMTNEAAENSLLF